VKYTITAVVPVAQYANLQPSIEVEAESIEEAEAKVLPYIEEFFNKYSDKAKIGAEKRALSTGRKLEKDIFGNEIFYDDDTHEYTNALGEVYLSGSKFAEQFEKPFDSEGISAKMAAKAGMPKEQADEIQKMWALKAKASAHFGTSIHEALELYGRFVDLGNGLKKETHMHDNPILNIAVESFYKDHPDTTNVGYECLIVDHAKKHAGRIDRLEYETPKDVYITDFKTNFDIKKSLEKYWKQLSFYADIIKANGLNVKGLKIYHFTGTGWDTIEHEVIDLEKITK
jgi:hypothetical protein